MRILLLKRGEQPVGLHAARQGRLRALSKGGDLESVTLTSVKIYPESRRFWPRFPLCTDSVTPGSDPGTADCARLDPYPSRRMPSNLGADWSASTLHLDVAAVPHRQRLVRGMLKLLATAVVAGTAHQLQRQHRWSVCIMCAASPR
jgi:hypothetical protein